jgi:HptB-dependent secretion and biofilm anti anti-sigma factor
MDQLNISESSNGVEITIPEKLSYTMHTEFKNAYANVPKFTKYIINFSRTKYVDSSGLGMLLILHEHNGGNKEDICFSNCSNAVYEIFRTATLEDFFTIQKES